MAKQLAVVAGARHVFRSVGGPAERGRSVHSLHGLPATKGWPRLRRSPGERCPPELLLVNPMAPLDFAVRLEPAGPNVSVPDTRGLDPQHKSKGKLLSVVTQQTLDLERKGPPELSQEGEARIMMQTPIAPQDTEACAIVQGGVLKRPAARDLYVPSSRPSGPVGSLRGGQTFCQRFFPWHNTAIATARAA